MASYGTECNAQQGAERHDVAGSSDRDVKWDDKSEWNWALCACERHHQVFVHELGEKKTEPTSEHQTPTDE